MVNLIKSFLNIKSNDKQKVESWSSWRVGSIVDAGFIKKCVVCEIYDNPKRFYLNTSKNSKITFFPYKGVRSGWVSDV